MAVTFDELGGWPGVLSRILAGEDLATDDATCVFSEILGGRASEAQIAAFAVGLRAKQESVDEINGFIASMYDHGDTVSLDVDAVDTCGTGGDRSGTINVSTAAAFVIAASGTPVCKHGGRASTSLTGSADVLEELGVAIELGPVGVKRCVEEVGIGFCFAPRYHPAMRHAAPVRRELGIPTIFNCLGPLANPAEVTRQVVGVGDASMAEKLLGVLEAKGARHAMVVFGHDGLDELSTVATSTVLETYLDMAGVRHQRAYEVDPTALGLAPADLPALRGGHASDNAHMLRQILSGDTGHQRDIVALNAAAGLIVADRVHDLVSGLEPADATLQSGAGLDVLDQLIKVSQEEVEKERS